MTYIRTKTTFKHRLKDLKQYNHVKIYVYELDALGVNDGPMMYDLRRRGWIWYDSKGNFKVLRDGPIQPSLLTLTKKRDKVEVPLNDMHKWMRDQLRFVTLPDVSDEEVPVYFKAFLKHRETDLAQFFSVDAFAGRIHTPVVNLKGDLRFKIRFHGSPVISLDVKQMQPTILGKVLASSVGKNDFSDAIDNGDDVYVMLQKQAGLETRPEAKKYLFQLIFGKPMEGIGSMFKGSTKWVDWINQYKSREESRNPHKEKKHSNLAWLLQYSEVRVMQQLWKKLIACEVPFLTIHDEILVPPEYKTQTLTMMGKELASHFKKFTINVTDGFKYKESIEY